MKCSFCGARFDEKAAGKACGTCSLFGGCESVKCPRCGYESPKEPQLLKRIRKLFGG